MKLGAQLYTLRKDTQSAEGLLASLYAVKELGYKAVQLSGQGVGISDEEIAGFLKETGLVCAATHFGFEKLKGDFAGVVKAHGLWGCGYVGLGSMPEEYRRSEEGFVAFAKEASELAGRFKAEGLCFIYHNHQFEFQRFGQKTGFELLMENSCEALQFEIDTFWMQVGGGDVPALIERAAGRSDVIHYKDLVIDGESKQCMAEIGQGNLNWEAILRASERAGVKWVLVEQDECRRPPIESLGISLEFLNGKGIF
ncbi:MAG: sugar phosphate isomerase/epimerase [Christensenellaceae bacterium]|nr:sugar phosphate isomerase/epimerase [Christensenellaceae bacterium]